MYVASGAALVMEACVVSGHTALSIDGDAVSIKNCFFYCLIKHNAVDFQH